MQKIPENFVYKKFYFISSWGGGRGRIYYPIFIFVNNRKSHKLMHCVDLLFLSGSFEDMAIFHRFFYLSVMSRYNPHPIKTKLKCVKILQNYYSKKFYAVLDLITFSIVYTNKMEMIDSTPAPNVPLFVHQIIVVVEKKVII